MLQNSLTQCCLKPMTKIKLNSASSILTNFIFSLRVFLCLLITSLINEERKYTRATSETERERERVCLCVCVIERVHTENNCIRVPKIPTQMQMHSINRRFSICSRVSLRLGSQMSRLQKSNKCFNHMYAHMFQPGHLGNQPKTNTKRTEN